MPEASAFRAIYIGPDPGESNKLQLPDNAAETFGGIVAGAQGQQLLYKDVNIPYASVRTLNSVPVVLVPSPGSGYGVVFEYAVVFKPAGTAYDSVGAGDDLSIEVITGAEVCRIETVGFMDQATAQIRWAKRYAAASGVNDVTPINAGLQIKALVGELYAAAGNCPLYVRVFYRIIPLTLAL